VDNDNRDFVVIGLKLFSRGYVPARVQKMQSVPRHSHPPIWRSVSVSVKIGSAVAWRNSVASYASLVGVFFAGEVRLPRVETGFIFAVLG
jgi:hypothetical protein